MSYSGVWNDFRTGMFYSRVFRLEERVSEIDTGTKQVEHTIHGLTESELEHWNVLTRPFTNLSLRTGRGRSKSQAEILPSLDNHPWHMYQHLIRRDSLSDALNLSFSRGIHSTRISGNGSTASEFDHVPAQVAGPCAEGQEHEEKLSKWSSLMSKVTLDRGIVCPSFFMYIMRMYIICSAYLITAEKRQVGMCRCDLTTAQCDICV